MKCVLCDQRKAKRACPACAGTLCARCCGEKRVLELDCPETCLYLKAGREYESKDFGKLLQSRDPQQQEKIKRILAENQDVVAHLEYTIAQHHLSSRDLTDGDVSGAVRILLEAYRTEDKGILYERDSEDLRVETLRRELREVLEAYRNPMGKEAEGIVDSGRSRVALRNVVECLEFIEDMIALYSDGRDADSRYVDFLARMTPRKESTSSIIIP
jgi:hypothetical protein